VLDKIEIKVCVHQRKPPGKPCCWQSGAEAVYRALEEELQRSRYDGSVVLRRSGCLDRCGQGPVVQIVKPDAARGRGLLALLRRNGQTLERVTADEVSRILETYVAKP
jgi:(2Fe-2S) ferredoxin